MSGLPHGDAGVTLTTELRNSDSENMREWRKVGEGTLVLAGSGQNELFLNLGGTGTTRLEQKGGYAAYIVFDMARLPEPATDTLSLLALAALAARRRRG